MDFIISVFSQADCPNDSLVKLFSDPDSLDTLLDDPLLFRELLERHNCLNVSRHFYFYILVRHTLRHAGIEDRTIADYVAEMLAEFSSAHRLRFPITGNEQPMDYIFEMLTALQTANESTAFLIRAHVGNHSLFVSGIFPDRIRYRAQFRGAPEMEYYEKLGSANFRVAGDHRLAQQYHLNPVFGALSEQFHTIRLALNDMTDRFIFLGDRDYSLENLLRKSQET